MIAWRNVETILVKYFKGEYFEVQTAKLSADKLASPLVEVPSGDDIQIVRGTKINLTDLAKAMADRLNEGKL